MGTAKIVLRIAGVASSAIGIMCLPVGFGSSPKRDLSAFFNLADVGEFVRVGLTLIAIGAVMFMVSYLGRGDE